MLNDGRRDPTRQAPGRLQQPVQVRLGALRQKLPHPPARRRMGKPQQPTRPRVRTQPVQIGQRPAARRKRRHQRPKRLAVRRPATPNLDRHALRQIPEKTQTLRRQGQGGTAPEAGQTGVRELVLNLQRAGCCACHRRTCRVVCVQPAFCRKNPCTVRLSKHFNDFLSGDQGPLFAGLTNAVCALCMDTTICRNGDFDASCNACGSVYDGQLAGAHKALRPHLPRGPNAKEHRPIPHRKKQPGGHGTGL